MLNGMFLKQIKDENPDITQEEISKLEAYKKSNRGGSNDDTGNLVADHTSYAGNHTMHVMGDECSNIDGDKVVNVEGDYRLKVTGDCHIEVGGGSLWMLLVQQNKLTKMVNLQKIRTKYKNILLHLTQT